MDFNQLRTFARKEAKNENKYFPSKMILKMDPDELITIKVQYLADTDPYNCLSMYPIPSRAPTYSFACTTPLATQLGSVLRLLGAPQRVRH